MEMVVVVVPVSVVDVHVVVPGLVDDAAPGCFVGGGRSRAGVELCLWEVSGCSRMKLIWSVDSGRMNEAT